MRVRHLMLLASTALIAACGGGSDSSSGNGSGPAATTVSASYAPKSIVLTWTASSDATYYKVMRKTGSGSGYSQVGSNVSGTTYTDVLPVHVTDWADLAYQVDACNASGCTGSNTLMTLDSVRATGYFKASNTNAGDLFGFAVAVSGDGSTIAIGAYHEASGSTTTQSDNSAANAGAVYVFTHTGSTWTQEAYLKASSPDAGDYFGDSLALSDDGNTLAVGVPQDDSGNTSASDNSAADAGAVYVFTRSGTTWSQQAYVKPTVIGAGDNFGTSVSLSSSGDLLAVGAISEASNTTGIDGNAADNSLSGAGAAYTFTRSGTTWSQQHYIKASNTAAGQHFGYRAILSGDGTTLAVSAPDESSGSSGINQSQTDISAPSAGAVYVFIYNGTTWTQQAYVKASNTETTDSFGRSVALSMDGSTLAIGAPQESSDGTGVNGSGQGNNNAVHAGAVYVFTRSNASWSQQAYVKASNTDQDDNFGWSVALDDTGDLLAVGAVHEGSSATGVDGSQSSNAAAQAGAVYMFSRTSGTWTQSSYVKASNTGTGDEFGYAVALAGDGDTLVVGAPSEGSNATGINGDGTNNAALSAGAAYVF